MHATNYLIDTFNTCSDLVYKMLFPVQTETKAHGLEQIVWPIYDAYVTWHMFDFVDEAIGNLFYRPFAKCIDLLAQFGPKIIDAIYSSNEDGIPIRNQEFMVGNPEFYKYEIVKRLTESLGFFDAFQRRHIIKTLSEIPGGLDIPENVLVSLRVDCPGLESLYDHIPVTEFNGLGHEQLPIRTSLPSIELGITIDDKEPRSMEPQGSLYDLAERWYHTPTLYKFYKSRLYQWFIESNTKTENLNDLGLSNIEKLTVIDSIWSKPTLVNNFQGWETTGPMPLEDSYTGGVYDVGRAEPWQDEEMVARNNWNFKNYLGVYVGPMKIRMHDALDAPQTTFLPFISKELRAHLGMFKNFAECRKPIYINNEFYMEGFETKMLAYFDMMMLPDFVSRFLQLRFNLVDNDKITYIQYIIAFSLRCYTVLIGFRYLLFWLLGLNPYQNFFSSVIATSVDWIETLLGAYVPSFYGVPLSIPLFQLLLTHATESIYKLTFTFPYLPSEVSIQYLYANGLLNQYPRLRDTVDPWDLLAMEKFIPKADPGSNTLIQLNNECRPFLKFEGLPKLWVENGIPDQIRFSWFWKHPLIFKKYYQDFEVSRIESNIQFLPNIILKDLNSNLHDLNLHDLQKMNTKELYSFLLENLSQNLRTDLVNLLFVESNAKHIDVSDFLDPARLEIYSEILKKVFDIN